MSEGRFRTLTTATTLALASIALSATIAGAQERSKCTRLKFLIAGKVASQKGKCLSLIFKKGDPSDPTECLAKADALLAKKWPKAEAKGDCIAPGADAANVVDVTNIFVAELFGLLSPSPQGGNKCTSLEYLSAGQVASRKVKCSSVALKKGVPIDPKCIAKANALLDRKWSKAQANGNFFCTVPGADAADALAVIDAFVARLTDVLHSQCDPQCPVGETCFTLQVPGQPAAIQCAQSCPCAAAFEAIDYSSLVCGGTIEVDCAGQPFPVSAPPGIIVVTPEYVGCVYTMLQGFIDASAFNADGTPADTDGDGVFDRFGGQCDNCPNDPNPGQQDYNGNGVGDACDPQCHTDADCDDGKTATRDVCAAGLCSNEPVICPDGVFDGTQCVTGDCCWTAELLQTLFGGVTPSLCKAANSTGDTAVLQSADFAATWTPSNEITTLDDLTTGSIDCHVEGSSQACVDLLQMSDLWTQCSEIECALSPGSPICPLNLVCDSSKVPGDPAAGLCVGCISSADCPAGSVCDVTNNACVQGQCASAADCDDGDPCTNNPCDAATHTCGPTSAVVCPSGEVCAPSGQNAGTCVECNSSADCSAGVCDVTSNTCVACVSAADCDDGDSCTNNPCNTATHTCGPTSAVVCPSGKVCAPSGQNAGTCVECNSSADCSAGVCDVTSNTCVACVSAADCDDGDSCTNNPCNTATHTCGLISDIVCPSGKVCAPSGQNAGTCVECNSSADCSAGVCDVTSNTCVACVSAADCDDGDPCTNNPCNTATHTCGLISDVLCPSGRFCAPSGQNVGRCVQCLTNADCVGVNMECSPNGDCLMIF